MVQVMLTDVVKSFGATTAVQGVSLDVPTGQVVALLGPSGCGKTTLLRCLAGLENPTSGEITIGDSVVYGKGGVVPPEERDIGFVFQSYALWPNMTVFKNVMYPLSLRRMPKDAARARVAEALELVGLTGFEARYPSQLSGGQQQRVAVARAIVARPRLLLFDEPLSSLDAKLREQVRDDLRDLLVSMGTTSVYVTHDQYEAMAVSDRIVLMRAGSIVHAGSAEDLYESPVNRFAANFIGSGSFVDVSVVRKDGRAVTTRAADGLEFQARAVETVRAGDAGQLLIRPESIKLSAAPEDSDAYVESVRNSMPNSWLGGVAKRTYLGNRTDYWIDLGPVTLRAETRGYEAQAYDVGASVLVQIEPDRVLCMRSAPAASANEGQTPTDDVGRAPVVPADLVSERS